MDAQKNWTRLALALILLTAAALRLYELDWDNSQHAHPDERWIAMVAPSITWPQRIGDLLDPRRSTLNPLWTPDGQGGGQPRNFAYGHLPLYLHSLIGHSLAGLGRLARRWGPAWTPLAQTWLSLGEYGGITLVGRLLSVLGDLGTIYLIYLLGRRIYGEMVGLMAAILVSFAVMHIQLAHFATFDVMTTFFIVLSLYGSVCVIQADRQNVWPTLWSGAAAGLAVASKFSAAPLIAVLVGAQIARASDGLDMSQGAGWAQALRRAALDIGLSLLAAFLAFFITSPFAILDWKLYAKQIAEQSTMVRGTADWPFTRQYRNTLPFIYQIEQQVRWGLGWPLGLAAFGGFVWTFVRQFRRPRLEEWVLLGWALPYFLLTGMFMVKFMRYMLPLTPLFILMGAAMMQHIVEWATAWHTSGGWRKWARRLLFWLPYGVMVCAALWSLAFIWVYAQEHTWIQASQWIYAHVPDGAVIAVEHWDDHLPLSLPQERANPGAHRYQQIELPMYEPDTLDKYTLLRSRLQAADYIVLSSNRLYRTIPRLPKRYPISTEFYRALFAGELGFVRQAEFTSYPGLFGLQVVDDAADESFTVYDHPKAIVWRKTRNLSDVEWYNLFADALAQKPVWQSSPTASISELFLFLNRRPLQEGQVKKDLLLDRPVGQLPVVADFGWNRWASNSTVGAVLVWWLVVSLLGWLAWPVVFVVFRGLRDRGYLLSRSVALLVVGYGVWLPASLRWLPNGLPLTLLVMAVLAVVSALLLRRHLDEVKAFVRERWRIIALGEVVFGAAFLFFVGIRLLNPDLWQPWNGGEKGMDIAYLNACMRSPYFPPYDPYYSDGYLNYYYYGQFLASIVTRLTGLTTSVAFNLAVPLYFALTVGNVFSVGYSLAGMLGAASPENRKRVMWGVSAGLLAVFCVALIGNLDSAVHVIEQLGKLSHSVWPGRLPILSPLLRALDGVIQIVFHQARFPGFDYWNRSRVVGNGTTINEFPYWSFLFADLHPHMMNIPFTALAVAFGLNWLLRRRAPAATIHVTDESHVSTGWQLVRVSLIYAWRQLDWGEVLNWLLWPLALGALAMINTWDFPAFAGFSGLILLFVWTRQRGRQGIAPALLAGLALTGGALLLCIPFFKYYTVLYAGLGWSLGRTATPLGEFLDVWGLMLFVALSFLVVLWFTGRSRWGLLRLLRLGLQYLPHLHRLEQAYRLFVHRPTAGYRRSLLALLGVLALLVFLAWKGYWVLVLLTPLLLLTLLWMIEPGLSDTLRFGLALIFTALLLLLGIELFYLKDFLDGLEGFWRMNTLFKFYMQVWMLLGIATGASLPELWQAVERWRPGWRRVWQLALGLLFFCAVLFLPLGTPARLIDRFPGDRPAIGTLDGMAFMTVGVYHWPNDEHPILLRGDYEAVRWLRDHVRGTPVIAEAPLGYYREFGLRVSSYVGLPTLIGMHQSEQRYDWQVGRRSGQARDLFTAVDEGYTMDLIRQLGVEYIYLGPLERIEYPQAAAKFDSLAFRKLLNIVYQNEQVIIYQVAADAR